MRPQLLLNRQMPTFHLGFLALTTAGYPPQLSDGTRPGSCAPSESVWLEWNSSEAISRADHKHKCLADRFLNSRHETQHPSLSVCDEAMHVGKNVAFGIRPLKVYTTEVSDYIQRLSLSGSFWRSLFTPPPAAIVAALHAAVSTFATLLH